MLLGLVLSSELVIRYLICFLKCRFLKFGLPETCVVACLTVNFGSLKSQSMRFIPIFNLISGSIITIKSLKSQSMRFIPIFNLISGSTITIKSNTKGIF